MTEALDIERVLLRLGIEAKKKGKEWWAKCPNVDHDDRSPSWRIRDDPGATKHGYHHCWPCGFSGTVVDLVQRVLKIEDYRDAIAWIEHEAPVDQKEVVGVEIQVRSPSLGFRLLPEVRFGPVDEWPGPARDYMRARGIENWQAERWGIGYAAEGRLAGRIVFVLRDARGRPKGYSARTFVDAKKRFLEPDSAEHASPSAMFGEQHWPPVAERGDLPVFVFEGAAKALAAERALDGCCVAATTGSELRSMHPVKLSTFGRQCLIGDDDPAGDRVSSQLYGCLVRHARPERLVLPRELDADDLPREELRDIMLAWLRRTR